jgi:ATP-dependent helicase/nuclease subunit B
MNCFIAALSALCRDYLLDEKWLLAPGRRAGYQWVDAVVRKGQPAVNVRVKTLRGLAADLASPLLAREERRLLSPLAALVMTERIWKRFSEKGGGYLSGIEPSQGLFEKIHSTLSALRLAGLTPEHLRPGAFEVGRKGEETRQLLSAYLAELRSNKYADFADLLRIAINRLRSDPDALPEGTLIVLPADADYRGLELKLVESIPEERKRVLPVDEPGASRGQAVEVFKAVGEANEVREAVRRCLEKGIPLDQVEILVSDSETYVPLIYELAERLKNEPAPNSPVETESPDFKVTFADGIPARYSRPARALSAWLDWMAKGCPQSTLVRMIQDGLLNFPPGMEGTQTFASLAQALKSIPISHRPDRYLPKINENISAIERRMKKQGELHGDDDEASKGRVSNLEARLASLKAVQRLTEFLLKHSLESDSPPIGILQSAKTFLKEMAGGDNKMDNFAREKFLEEIEELSTLLERGGGGDGLDVRAWLSLLPDRVQLEGSGPRPGCLHVASFQSGGHTSRAHTFLLGLDDGRFPGAGLQDPLLLDSERRALSPNLGTSADRLSQRLTAFGHLLARLRGQVTLSYSFLSVADGREMFPSAALSEAVRLSGRTEQEWDVASFAPVREERCLNQAEWWLWRLSERPLSTQATASVEQWYPHLARGNQAASSRESEEITPYDGLILEREETCGEDRFNPFSPEGPVLSAGSLQTVGACPLRYFFKVLLQIKPPEETVPDPDQWLDPLTSGSLLHEVFREFMASLIEKGELPNRDRDMPLLESILARQVARYRDLYPPASEAVFKARCEDLLAAAKVFLGEEEEFCRESTPLFLEVALGMKQDGCPTPMDTAEPIPFQLPDGKRIHVRGRIDRIDQVGEGAYSIWDYKTGSASIYRDKDPFRQGRLVQHALYLAMAEARLKQVDSGTPGIKEFGYFFPGSKESGERISWAPGELSAGAEIIQNLSRIIASGAFLATDNAKDCAFCDYQPICRDVEATAARSGVKLDNPGNTMLNPFRALRPREEEAEES